MGTYYAYIRAVYVQRVPLKADNLDDAQKETDELAGEVCPALDGECADWDVESVSED